MVELEATSKNGVNAEDISAELTYLLSLSRV